MIVTTLGRSRRRRGRRWLWRSLRLAIILGVIVLSLGAAYEAGRSQSDTEAARLLEDLQNQREMNRQLDARLADLQQRWAGASSTAASPQPTTAAPVEATPTAGLMALIRSKLADGVEPARLGAAIEGVTRERRCDPAVETHRIVLGTPVSRDATSAVFAGGRLTVSGKGVSVRDAAGLPEAWFDPAQPVELEIRTSDGRIAGASGLLPLKHTIVQASHEYALTAKAGQRRGVLDLSVQVCAYP